MLYHTIHKAQVSDSRAIMALLFSYVLIQQYISPSSSKIADWTQLYAPCKF